VPQVDLRLVERRARLCDLRLGRLLRRCRPQRLGLGGVEVAAGMSARSDSSRARISLRCASATSTRLRSTSASSRATVAWAWSTCVWNSDGSSFATTCPLRTEELKSAYSDWMVPDTWVPT
jgi:hypothetical protein